MAVLIMAFLGLVAFSVVLAKVTLTPSPASEDLVASNLRPGRSLRQYAEDYTFLAACKQAGGNLLLGTPFGILLPVLVPRRLRMLRMVLLTVLIMVVIELVQGALVAGRAFDIDDVILNTTGALLGYALLGRRISHRFHALGDGPSGDLQAAADNRDKPKAKPKPKSKPKWKPKAGAKSKPKSKPEPKPKPRAGRGLKSRARPGTPAPTARGRALADWFRGRRRGTGGGAPGTRRRRT